VLLFVCSKFEEKAVLVDITFVVDETKTHVASRVLFVYYVYLAQAIYHCDVSDIEIVQLQIKIFLILYTGFNTMRITVERIQVLFLFQIGLTAFCRASSVLYRCYSIFYITAYTRDDNDRKFSSTARTDPLISVRATIAFVSHIPERNRSVTYARVKILYSLYIPFEPEL